MIQMIYTTKVTHPIVGTSTHIIFANSKREMLYKLFNTLEEEGYRYDEWTIDSIHSKGV